jgi:hypothetical protein
MYNGITNTYIYALAASPASVGTGVMNLFASTESGVYFSNDNGVSWIHLDYGLTTTPVWSFAANGIDIFTATNGGVFLCTDNGTGLTPRFSVINSGLTNTTVQSLTVTDGYLFAGTIGDGVWKRPLSEIMTGIENSRDQVTLQYILNQNYPNPFNPSTTIRYEIPRQGHVTLKIYNIIGQEVETLIDEQRNAGRGEVVWNASRFSSGVYFSRFRAGEFTKTMKLILVK